MPVTINDKLKQLNIIHAYFACVPYTPSYRPFTQWDADAINTYAAWEPYWKVRRRSSGLFNSDLNRHLSNTMRAHDTPRAPRDELIGSAKSLAPEKLFYARWSNR